MSKTAFTPIELTRNEPNKKVTPGRFYLGLLLHFLIHFKLIAVAIATNDIGVTINNENATLISISTNNGFKSVKE